MFDAVFNAAQMAAKAIVSVVVTGTQYLVKVRPAEPENLLFPTITLRLNEEQARKVHRQLGEHLDAPQGTLRRVDVEPMVDEIQNLLRRMEGCLEEAYDQAPTRNARRSMEEAEMAADNAHASVGRASGLAERLRELAEEIDRDMEQAVKESEVAFRSAEDASYELDHATDSGRAVEDAWGYMEEAEGILATLRGLVEDSA